jgi:D-alanine--poly(phosphoribitol) ligase subunit 1
MCSSYEVQLSDFADLNGLPPLGEINQNIDYMILDELGETSTLGELYLIGDNVALGYINDPERTASAFTTIKTPDRFGKRMYRTGDIVDIRDGTLRFAGRKDNQIKHMGYRIELEEIESALSAQANVTQAVAIYVRVSTDFGRIIAFASTSSNSLTEHQIREDSRERLPSYMVPSRIFVLQNLPKNQNGKVDRLGLSQSFSAGVFD